GDRLQGREESWIFSMRGTGQGRRVEATSFAGGGGDGKCWFCWGFRRWRRWKPPSDAMRIAGKSDEDCWCEAMSFAGGLRRVVDMEGCRIFLTCLAQNTGVAGILIERSCAVVCLRFKGE